MKSISEKGKKIVLTGKISGSAEREPVQKLLGDLCANQTCNIPIPKECNTIETDMAESLFWFQLFKQLSYQMGQCFLPQQGV